MRVLGVDVGVKCSHYVVTCEKKVVEKGKIEETGKMGEVGSTRETSEPDLDGILPRVDFAGIDAPLSFPRKGSLRECEKKLYKFGIRLFPSGAEFFKPVVLKGIEIAQSLRKNSVEVYEVYPFATRKILGIAPESKKNRKAGLERIKFELRKYLEFDDLENSDLVDAAIAALTVELYLEGKGELVSGKDGSILIPSLGEKIV
ncbi:DUF429 domain-containing protein [Archaeoglobales archaeon]|nr:MAG: DUF429 domain-containing protein [Archaeoglobales archaeon]